MELNVKYIRRFYSNTKVLVQIDNFKQELLLDDNELEIFAKDLIEGARNLLTNEEFSKLIKEYQEN